MFFYAKAMIKMIKASLHTPYQQEWSGWHHGLNQSPFLGWFVLTALQIFFKGILLQNWLQLYQKSVLSILVKTIVKEDA